MKIRQAWVWGWSYFTQYLVIFKSNFTFIRRHFKLLYQNNHVKMPFSVSNKGNKCQKEMNMTELMPLKSSESPEGKGGD